MADRTSILSVERVERSILMIRGHKAMLDADLYKIPTKALNQAVKRSRDRFPGDFMFQLTKAEKAEVVIDCDYLSLFLGGELKDKILGKTVPITLYLFIRDAWSPPRKARRGPRQASPSDL